MAIFNLIFIPIDIAIAIIFPLSVSVSISIIIIAITIAIRLFFTTESFDIAFFFKVYILLQYIYLFFL